MALNLEKNKMIDPEISTAYKKLSATKTKTKKSSPNRGPWIVVSNSVADVEVNQICKADDPSFLIATVLQDWVPTSPIDEANLKLMAAAPELAKHVASFLRLVFKMRPLCEKGSWESIVDEVVHSAIKTLHEIDPEGSFN